MSVVRAIIRRIVPTAVRQWWQRGGGVAMGDLRMLEPPGRLMGLDRGQPICRWYIDRFLEQNAIAITGTALEVADRHYTSRFGGTRVTKSDVLHAETGNADATIVGDLATGRGIPHAAYDVLILTQVLQCVFDVSAAVRHAHDALKPDGVLLASLAGIAPISRYDADRWGEYWHFTTQSAQRLFEPVFGAANVEIRSWGNHVAAHAYLAGMAAEELTAPELDANDPDFPIVITVRATRR